VTVAKGAVAWPSGALVADYSSGSFTFNGSMAGSTVGHPETRALNATRDELQ
jgi:hypothetical protein